MSQRKKDPFELDPFEVVQPFVPFAPWPAPVRIEIIETPKPVWLAVIERIMVKAKEHKNAGREGQFTQVLVPKADFEALKEHFGEEPFVATCLGVIDVYPVNPDGATFVD